MSNLLEEASQWLSGQLDEHASSDVSYRRGSLTVSLVAGNAKTTFDLVDSSGMISNVQSHDFIVTSDTIVLDDVKCAPQVGDRIQETIGDQLHEYEVMRFGTEQCYRPCDPYGHKLRIHTKFLGQVSI